MFFANLVIDSLQVLGIVLCVIFFAAVIPTAWILITDDLADRETANHRRARGVNDPYLQLLVRSRHAGHGGIRSHRKGLIHA